jgi:hypothetical protein
MTFDAVGGESLTDVCISVLEVFAAGGQSAVGLWFRDFTASECDGGFVRVVRPWGSRSVT